MSDSLPETVVARPQPPAPAPAPAPAPRAPQRRRPDQGAQTVALATTVVLHLCVAATVVWGSMGEAKPAEVEPQHIMTELYELPKLGVPPPPNALPRIVQAPQPEAAPVAPVNLTQQRDEEAEKPVEKKPEAVEKPSEQTDPEALKREQHLDKKRRQKELERAMAQLDPRADEDSPDGLADGVREGTSNRAAKIREEALWAAQVGDRIREHLQRPATITPGECRQLHAVLTIVLDARGSIVNSLAISDSSGNRFFDDAALRAVRAFTAEGGETLPLPNAARLADFRKQVMHDGVPVQLECAQ